MEETVKTTTTMKHQMTRTQMTKKLVWMTTRNKLQAKQRGEVILIGNREKVQGNIPEEHQAHSWDIYTEAM